MSEQITNREAWLNAFAASLRPFFGALSLDWGAYLVASVGRVPGKEHGLYVPASQSRGGQPAIYVSPAIADIRAVGPAVVHQLLHACLAQVNHAQPFPALARKMGLCGRTLESATERLHGILADVAGPLGHYPHEEEYRRENRPGKPGRMLKAQCPGCGMVIRTARAWIGVPGLPTCACGRRFGVAPECTDILDAPR